MSSSFSNPQTLFHVSHLGQTYGPWPMKEIADRVARMELLGSDFIFDDIAGDWIPLVECASFLAELKNRKPATRPVAVSPGAVSPGAVTRDVAAHESVVPHIVVSHVVAPNVVVPSVPLVLEQSSAVSEASTSRWILVRGRARSGSMSYAEVLKGLQEKRIFGFDLLMKEGEAHAKSIAEFAEFQSEKIRLLTQDPMALAANVFLQRQFARFTYMNEVMVHNNRQVWIGQTYQASEGGSGLVIRTPGLMPGQIVKLHYASHDGLPAFNVEGEIVSKKLASDVRNPKAAVPYGVRFLELRKEIRDVFSDYLTRRNVS